MVNRHPDSPFASVHPDPIEELTTGPRGLGLKSSEPSNPVIYWHPSRQDSSSNEAMGQGSPSGQANDYDYNSEGASLDPNPNGLIAPMSARDDSGASEVHVSLVLRNTPPDVL